MIVIYRSVNIIQYKGVVAQPVCVKNMFAGATVGVLFYCKLSVRQLLVGRYVLVLTSSLSQGAICQHT